MGIFFGICQKEKPFGNDIFSIFVSGLVGISYPMKGEVTTLARFFLVTQFNLVTMIEIWKDISGYEGLYQVSNKGRIYSLGRRIIMKNGRSREIKSRVLKHSLDSKGYPFIVLYDFDSNRKQGRIHRLVAEAFIPNPNNKPTVNHKNSIRHDNNIENLEWATHSENTIHGYKYGNMKPNGLGNFGRKNIKSKPVLQFTKDGKFVAEYEGHCDAHRKTGVNRGHISEVTRGEKKSAGGFVWKNKN